MTHSGDDCTNCAPNLMIFHQQRVSRETFGCAVTSRSAPTLVECSCAGRLAARVSHRSVTSRWIRSQCRLVPVMAQHLDLTQPLPQQQRQQQPQHKHQIRRPPQPHKHPYQRRLYLLSLVHQICQLVRERFSRTRSDCYIRACCAMVFNLRCNSHGLFRGRCDGWPPFCDQQL